VTVAVRTFHAVPVVFGTAGLCRRLQRPQALAQKGLRLQIFLAILKAHRKLILLLNNISDRPGNLPKSYAIIPAESYAGLRYEITEDDPPANVRVDANCAAGLTIEQPPTEERSVPAKAQAPKTNGLL